jgi:hypothetical protein
MSAMDSSFKNYDEILDLIKKRVQERLSPKDGVEVAVETNDSDMSGDDDLDWEFTENDNASVEDLVEFRTEFPIDESLKLFAEVAHKRIKQASYVPVVNQTEEELSNVFYKELEKAEFFISIQERFIQKSRILMQNNQKIDIGDFLTEMVEEYHCLKSK